MASRHDTLTEGPETMSADRTVSYSTEMRTHSPQVSGLTPWDPGYYPTLPKVTNTRPTRNPFDHKPQMDGRCCMLHAIDQEAKENAQFDQFDRQAQHMVADLDDYFDQHHKHRSSLIESPEVTIARSWYPCRSNAKAEKFQNGLQVLQMADELGGNEQWKERQFEEWFMRTSAALEKPFNVHHHTCRRAKFGLTQSSERSDSGPPGLHGTGSERHSCVEFDRAFNILRYERDCGTGVSELA